MTVYIRDPVSAAVTIAFGGDLVPGSPDHKPVAKSDELLGLLRSCDAVVVNLECPLTSAGSSKTRGFSSLSAAPSNADELRKFNMSIVNLANNHIMDRGLGGLEETLSVLDKKGIVRMGAGRDFEEASRPCFWHAPGAKVAFLAYSGESPFVPSTSGPAWSGACPLVMSQAQDTIALLKRQGYVVCVSYHGGEEFFRIPSPRRRALFQELAINGADLVIGHHAHVFQGLEIMDRSLLAYGLGNFLMTTPYQLAHKGTAIGLLLTVEMDAQGPFAYSTHFVHNQRERQTVALVRGKSEAPLRKLLGRLSVALRDRGLRTREWRRDCLRMLWSMNDARALAPLLRLYRAVRISLGALKKESEAARRFAYPAQKVLWDGIRGIPSALIEPGDFTACYKAYEVKSEIASPVARGERSIVRHDQENRGWEDGKA